MLPLSVPIECGTLNATPLYTHRMWHTQCNPSLPPWNITCWFCYFTFCRNLGVLSVPSSVCSVILPWQVLAVLGFCFSCFHTYSLFFWVLVLYCVVDYFLILMAPLPFKKLLSMLLTFFFFTFMVSLLFLELLSQMDPLIFPLLPLPTPHFFSVKKLFIFKCILKCLKKAKPNSQPRLCSKEEVHRVRKRAWVLS